MKTAASWTPPGASTPYGAVVPFSAGEIDGHGACANCAMPLDPDDPGPLYDVAFYDGAKLGDPFGESYCSTSCACNGLAFHYRHDEKEPNR